MAFVTPSELLGAPDSYDTDAVKDILVGVQASLQRMSFKFSNFTATTRVFKTDGFLQTIFKLGFAKTITSVRIVNTRNGTFTTLTLGTDYVIPNHPRLTEYTNRLELLPHGSFAIRNLKYDYYQLEVTAVFGIYIDFGLTNNFEVDLLTSIIRKFVKKSLLFAERGYEQVIESTVDDTITRLNNKDMRKYYDDIVADPEFNVQLNYFR